MHILIIGAGPVGLEAAFTLSKSGHRVTVVERDRAGANVRRWGHVTFFSPWALNTSALGLEALRQAGYRLPDPAAYPTGQEFYEVYLRPLAEIVSLQCTLLEHTEVVRVGRVGVLKTEAIGHDARSGRLFRALVRRTDGNEQWLYADAVLDCSGTYGNPNGLGPDGLPAIGESTLGDRITWVIPDILGTDRARYANRTTLVVGGGFSAATTLSLLLSLHETAPQTRVVWVTRAERDPYERIPDDVLPERDRLAELGNAVAAARSSIVEYVAGAYVERVAAHGDGARVHLELRQGGTRVIDVDQIVANVGYRPDTSMLRELQIHQCYATEGPMKLAATLLASDAGSDCMAQPAPSSETLTNPEPGFYVIGSKSYGRTSAFLLKVGLQQIATVHEQLQRL